MGGVTVGGAGASGSGGGMMESLTSEPARFFITTSADIPGGGVYPNQITDVYVGGPQELVDIYVWVDLGNNDFLGSFGLTLAAETAGVVRGYYSEVYNPDITFTLGGPPIDIGDRWRANGVKNGAINPDGEGQPLLVANAGAFTLGGNSTGVLAEQDGSGEYAVLDNGYDPTGGAFLLQRITLAVQDEATGQDVGLVLSIGQMAMWMGATDVEHPILLGTGTEPVGNGAVGATDGTIHATVHIGQSGSPGALVVAASPTSFALPTVASPAPFRSSAGRTMTALGAGRVESAIVSARGDAAASSTGQSRSRIQSVIRASAQRAHDAAIAINSDAATAPRQLATLHARRATNRHVEP
jgi:hypothetical protein